MTTNTAATKMAASLAPVFIYGIRVSISAFDFSWFL